MIIVRIARFGVPPKGVAAHRIQRNQNVQNRKSADSEILAVMSSVGISRYTIHPTRIVKVTWFWMKGLFNSLER